MSEIVVLPNNAKTHKEKGAWLRTYGVAIEDGVSEFAARKIANSFIKMSQIKDNQ